jgi:uncharacterized protein
MSKPSDGRIDLRGVGPEGMTLQGVVPLASLARLAEAVHRAEGEARYELRLEDDPRGFVAVRGRIDATVELVCQRCLEPMSWTIEAWVALAVARSEGLLQRVPDDLEPELAPEGSLDLAGMVEDELLLALPLVARHTAPCSVDAPSASTDTTEGPAAPNPFAALAKLKSRH